MRRNVILLTVLAAAFVGCDATEEAVLSDRDMSESTGNVLGDLNQRQTNDVEGMSQAGSINEYEKEQMEQAIGSTK